MTNKLTSNYQPRTLSYRSDLFLDDNTDSKTATYAVGFFGTLLALFVGWKIKEAFSKKADNVSSPEEETLKRELNLRPLRRRNEVLQQVETLRKNKKKTPPSQPPSGTQSDNEIGLPKIFPIERSFSNSDLKGLEELSLLPPNRSSTQPPPS